MLAALECVTAVVVFDEETPLELIREIRPQALVKGADYTLDQVVGRDLVVAWGGDVILVPLLPGHSTTALVAELRGARRPPERHGGALGSVTRESGTAAARVAALLGGLPSWLSLSARRAPGHRLVGGPVS